MLLESERRELPHQSSQILARHVAEPKFLDRCETKTLDNVFVNVVVSVQYQVRTCSKHCSKHCC